MKKEKKCKHKWIANGMVVFAPCNDCESRVVISCICEKCGKIKHKIIYET